jgi:hypothetical protein
MDSAPSSVSDREAAKIAATCPGAAAAAAQVLDNQHVYGLTGIVDDAQRVG